MHGVFCLSEDPCCAQANHRGGEQDPGNQLKPLGEWSSHGLIEWVVPQRRLVKLLKQGVGFQLLAGKQQLHHLVPNESGQAFCFLPLMPGLELDRRQITRVVVKS